MMLSACRETSTEHNTLTNETTLQNKSEVTKADAITPTVTELKTLAHKPLKYHWLEEDLYSIAYLDSIYVIAEYYVTHTSNGMIKWALSNKEQLEYSIEKRTENEKEYDMLGIGYSNENRFTIMQWIFVDVGNERIFEYDLANEILIPFDYRK